ncbi:carbon-phosphorus lyase complex subunit PhnI [Clostridiisalibacter paucivorans]|uniref:carbon-phosphorus lyase complex subunit PhnI n=1 Tax=Clostridiisalibacter paucivorans TaxID=408753 RepID=UPI00047AABEB|nr:carbon-phosphorus lyase complex subunit PhnI [Clostridiisalibacter paucivorans]
MGYVAVKGGTNAIAQSIKRLKYNRIKKGEILSINEIESGMRGLIDQVMSESSIYCEELAAISIKQAEGNPEEAVFLLRAYRSTLPRKHYSKVVRSEDMTVERRISASFKDIPGGQILGASYDYTHRLIDFDLADETKEELIQWLENFNKEVDIIEDSTDINKLPKVLDYLRSQGLISDCGEKNNEPKDITKKSIEFPTERSERLQILTRGQTGAVTSLGYAALRGYGDTHPTIGELRVGSLPIYVDNPLNNDHDDEDSFYIGEIKVTEVETLFPASEEKEDGKVQMELEIGYGICYGQNETKAIAMSILDHCLEIGDPRYPTHDEEFVLLHIDSIESSGFISHLKLPHYVTFKSKLDSIVKTRKGE